jgi:5-methylcytosine-specific restriction protein A
METRQPSQVSWADVIAVMRRSAASRGYGEAWRKARKGYLRSHPHCIKCAGMGQQITATVVDHIKPHRGSQSLFWDKGNWQPLCETHHNSTKQRDEARGYASGSDARGRPIDPNHPWNSKPTPPV